MGASLLFVGLVISIIGWNKKGPETLTQDIQGTEVVIKNSDAQHFNWRAFMGLTFAILGTGLWAFPSQKKFEEWRYGRD